ncbi:MAG: DUF4268 domain-containing protein, partial [Geminicoccaceae bacterium]
RQAAAAEADRLPLHRRRFAARGGARELPAAALAPPPLPAAGVAGLDQRGPAAGRTGPGMLWHERPHRWLTRPSARASVSLVKPSEIELWQIGNSVPAPRFNVVASPNDWARSARSAVRQVNDAASAERHRVRLDYWASFGEYLNANSSTFRMRRANKDHWFSFGIGRSSFNINAAVSADKQRIGVELYMSNDLDKSAFYGLLADKEAIEQEFGYPLEWQELPGKRASRIVIYHLNINPTDEQQRKTLHEWMFDKMERFQKTFKHRIRILPSSGIIPTARPVESEEHDS